MSIVVKAKKNFEQYEIFSYFFFQPHHSIILIHIALAEAKIYSLRLEFFPGFVSCQENVEITSKVIVLLACEIVQKSEIQSGRWSVNPLNKTAFYCPVLNAQNCDWNCQYTRKIFLTIFHNIFLSPLHFLGKLCNNCLGETGILKIFMLAMQEMLFRFFAVDRT